MYVDKLWILFLLVFLICLIFFYKLIYRMNYSIVNVNVCVYCSFFINELV